VYVRIPGRKRLVSKGGFTLVELIMVVFIIGLLIAFLIPNFIRARATTLTNKCVNNLRLIQAAKENYAIENPVPYDTVPSEADIQIYLKMGEMPSEPMGSTYSINALNTGATCNSGLPGHEY